MTVLETCMRVADRSALHLAGRLSDRNVHLNIGGLLPVQRLAGRQMRHGRQHEEDEDEQATDDDLRHSRILCLQNVTFYWLRLGCRSSAEGETIHHACLGVRLSAH